MTGWFRCVVERDTSPADVVLRDAGVPAVAGAVLRAVDVLPVVVVLRAVVVVLPVVEVPAVVEVLRLDADVVLGTVVVTDEAA